MDTRSLAEKIKRLAPFILSNMHAALGETTSDPRDVGVWLALYPSEKEQLQSIISQFSQLTLDSGLFKTAKAASELSSQSDIIEDLQNNNSAILNEDNLNKFNATNNDTNVNELGITLAEQELLNDILKGSASEDTNSKDSVSYSEEELNLKPAIFNLLCASELFDTELDQLTILLGSPDSKALLDFFNKQIDSLERLHKDYVDYVNIWEKSSRYPQAKPTPGLCFYTNKNNKKFFASTQKFFTPASADGLKVVLENIKKFVGIKFEKTADHTFKTIQFYVERILENPNNFTFIRLLIKLFDQVADKNSQAKIQMFSQYLDRYLDKYAPASDNNNEIKRGPYHSA